MFGAAVSKDCFFRISEAELGVSLGYFVIIKCLINFNTNFLLSPLSKLEILFLDMCNQRYEFLSWVVADFGNL